MERGLCEPSLQSQSKPLSPCQRPSFWHGSLQGQETCLFAPHLGCSRGRAAQARGARQWLWGGRLSQEPGQPLLPHPSSPHHGWSRPKALGLVRCEPRAALRWSLSVLGSCGSCPGGATQPADCSASGATALSQQNSSDYFDIFPSRELPCNLQGSPHRHVELRGLLLVISKGRDGGGAVLCRVGAEL